MPTLLAIILTIVSLGAWADTMDHYMNISNQIPQMQMKADEQAQAWARSARAVLTITNETVAETLSQANELAAKQGKHLFCLPAGVQLNAVTLEEIILNTYKEISSQQSDKDKMTVSQLAWLGVMKTYPCQEQANAQNYTNTRVSSVSPMQHIGGFLQH